MPSEIIAREVAVNALGVQQGFSGPHLYGFHLFASYDDDSNSSVIFYSTFLSLSSSYLVVRFDAATIAHHSMLKLGEEFVSFAVRNFRPAIFR